MNSYAFLLIHFFIMLFCYMSPARPMKETPDNGRFLKVRVINQISYEKSENNNFNGALMCGFFATYNGLTLLKAIKNSTLKNFSTTRLLIQNFNAWLKDNENILAIAKSENRIGNIRSGVIEALIQQTIKMTPLSDDEINHIIDKGANLNSQAFENITIQDYQDYDKNKKLSDKKSVLKNITRFRKNNEPQMIVLLTPEHWISLIITEEKTVFMDSLNSNDGPLTVSVTNPPAAVKIIDHLFREMDLSVFNTSKHRIQQKIRPNDSQPETNHQTPPAKKLTKKRKNSNPEQPAAKRICRNHRRTELADKLAFATIILFISSVIAQFYLLSGV